jgi:hypothetical protein
MQVVLRMTMVTVMLTKKGILGAATALAMMTEVQQSLAGKKGKEWQGSILREPSVKNSRHSHHTIH